MLAVRNAEASTAELPVDAPVARESAMCDLLLRIVIVAAQAASIAISWRLWQVRVDLPLLPVIDGPAIDMLWPLLGSLVVVLFAPRVGIALHAVTLLVAILLDQTRLQPEFLSLALLLLATLPSPTAKLLVRLHLSALWFYTGFHKLVSPDFEAAFAEHVWQPWFPRLSDYGQTVAWALVALEIGLGVCSLIPRMHRVTAVGAVVLHVGIVAALWGIYRPNYVVWPWNLALSLVAVALFWPPRPGLRIEWRRASVPLRVAALVVLASPLGYYAGVLDAYLAYCLYTANVPTAQWNGNSLELVTLEELRVPLPPTHRTFEAFFRAVAQPDDVLRIQDPRWCAKIGGYDRRFLMQP